MVIRGAAMALVGCVFATGVARAGPYEEELAAQAAKLRQQASEPAAVAAVAELAGLDEVVAPSALEAAVRGGVAPGAHPLVAAHAALLLAHLLDQRGETKEAAAVRAGPSTGRW
jgi:hypothetical protein